MKEYHYNYTQNVRCHDLKPIERKFFKYVIRQLDYDSIDTMHGSGRLRDGITIRKLANTFSEKYNVNYKQLMYFLSKWERKFYGYSVFQDLGWFENLDELILKKSIPNYSDAVPDRVERLYIKAYNKNKRTIVK